ncbi:MULTISPECIES: C40 family peptidase [Prauserella salsuginis group]|uniref:C40 family peptidase n=1 Tax=Prauserella salsuginis TaxID=387889 RepID=A0ABW6G525_9PSEU|nr:MULTISPECIES: C40 family peptidase [Prauserella salsuginis group]MCR3718851.1 NlpC/P60 family protein [Prauserella flava]MCR3733421.1 NlpC/P60 family protein [Prauserella salsuginis]
MTSGETETASSTAPASGSPASLGRRRFATLLALATAVVLAAGVITAVQLSPDPSADTGAAAAAADGAAAGGQPAESGGMSPSRRTPQPEPAPEDATSRPAQRVPQEQGARFEAWVDEVAGWLDIPRRAMHAYATATVRLEQEQPGCNLSWVTLAGIGRTTSDHGREGDRQLTRDGRPTSPIGTIELRNFAGDVISQAGAEGPLQLSPAAWQRWAATASGDAPNIQDIDDAALTAGRALCDGGRDLDQGQQWLAGVSALHDEPLFLHRVLATANVYGTVGMSDEPPNKKVLQAVTFAIEKIGLPYVWGGNGTEQGDAGFDCSGLTTAAYGKAGVSLERTAHWQYSSLPIIGPDEEPRLGDLVFFGDPNTKIHHVGMYIGNQQMIDAPTFGQAVQVHNYRKPGDSYAGAGRPVA